MNLSSFLAATETVEVHHPAVAAFTTRYLSGSENERNTGVRLYYAVRDGIRYDPYTFSLKVDDLKASHTIETGRAWCVPKAILLAACCRHVGIPAKLGYADVRNHLSTAAMREAMQGDIFYWHGYASIYIEGRWLKVTPAFNIELCRKFKLRPLEFDGRSDALFHPFDAVGNRHMEYLQYRGEFADVPIDQMEKTFQELYPHWMSADDQRSTPRGDFDRDVEKETTS
ncbi:MAG: transglutaminase family protein [Smithellaceae bacterium]|nr:transglutaminase family protein [Smithellaceae bacterium]